MRSSKLLTPSAGGVKLWGVRILLALASVGVSLLVLEGGFRFIEHVARVRQVFDDQLGWRQREYTTKVKSGKRIDGHTYTRTISTSKYGFKLWQKPNPALQRLLVLGDSFTDAPQVSNEKTYYGVLQGRLGPGWQVFACGVSGYGTLQEYMVLDSVWDEIQPTLVLWQWCGNDFVNNLFEWDATAVGNAGFYPRPYLENGRIVVRCPRQILGLSGRSHLYLYFAPRVFNALKHPPSVEFETLSRDSPILHRAIMTTREILGLARKRVGQVPVFCFTTGDDEPYSSTFQLLAKEHGFTMIEGIVQGLKEMERSGSPVEADGSIGGHWSEEGHLAVANVIYEALKKDPVLRERIGH